MMWWAGQVTPSLDIQPLFVKIQVFQTNVYRTERCSRCTEDWVLRGEAL
jgi:hypothetical protein